MSRPDLREASTIAVGIVAAFAFVVVVGPVVFVADALMNMALRMRTSSRDARGDRL